MASRNLHIIFNTHIDPVWIWTRRSGRNAWLNSIASNVALLKEHSDLRFVCSASALYRWVEECAPALFEDIRALVREGRWEIVGGWEVQSDAILARLEPLVRQGLVGKEYFRERFGVEVKIGYNVDSFGHSAGLPQILQTTGFTHYCFMRPQMQGTPVFLWKGPAGSRVVGLNIKESYGTDNAITEKAFFAKLEHFMETGEGEQALFFGVGDHGGGLFRKHLAWFREAEKSFPLKYSTLGEYFSHFDADDLPVVEDELGPVFKGCYSANHTVKAQVARATRRLLTAERLGVPAVDLAEAWRELLFQHFHDILPGTSIRSAYEKDVYPGLGAAMHLADEAIDRELSRRASRKDTTFMQEGGLQVWNPHPLDHQTIVEVTNFSDPNGNGVDFDSCVDEAGRVYPLQFLPPATTFGPCGRPWHCLTTVIPVLPFSERLLALAHTGRSFPKVGFARLREIQKNISLPIYYDNTRTWGFGLEAFQDFLGEAECEKVEEFQDGPVCAILRSHWRWRSSTIRIDLVQYAGLQEIGVQVRLDWHEVRCALKLAFAHGLSRPDFLVGEAGAVVRKLSSEHYEELGERFCTWENGRLADFWPESKEAPFVDWCAATDQERLAAVFAPDLHSCDHARNQLRITLLRPTLYADHFPFAQPENDGWMGLGVSFRKLWYYEGTAGELAELPKRAQARLENGEAIEVTSHEADAGVSPAACPPAFSAKTTVLTSARRGADGSWSLTLKNYGLAEVIRFANGTTVEMQADELRFVDYSQG